MQMCWDVMSRPASKTHLDAVEGTLQMTADFCVPMSVMLGSYNKVLYNNT